jgi:hypothetical protein
VVIQELVVEVDILELVDTVVCPASVGTLVLVDILAKVVNLDTVALVDILALVGIRVSVVHPQVGIAVCLAMYTPPRQVHHLQ